MCDEYDFDVEDIDLIPVRFGDIDVRTLNCRLLCKTLYIIVLGYESKKKYLGFVVRKNWQ